MARVKYILLGNSPTSWAAPGMTNYKRVQIIHTNLQLADDGKYLFALSGRVRKVAGRQPFLTSGRQCKRYIDDTLEQDELRHVFTPYGGTRRSHCEQ